MTNTANTTKMDTIDLFQEAFNFMVTIYNRKFLLQQEVVNFSSKESKNQKLENFSFGSFAISNYFKLFPKDFSELCEKYFTIAQQLERYSDELRYKSEFSEFVFSSKAKIIDILCKTIHLEKLPQKIDSYMLGETCDNCIFKEHTKQWLYCDSCSWDIDVFQMDRSKYEQIFEDHLSGEINYEDIDNEDEEKIFKKI